MEEDDGVDAADVFRIMVSTDNHLGYLEKDAVRGDDSFIAFEEMLAMAVEENVDFILLGGDLFHDAVPSQKSLHRCINLLRRYVFGSKEITFEILSDQAENFHSSVTETVNYEDLNLNISIPVFSIHGNHDDPSSFDCLSSLDLLSTAGLVNYIGRCTNLTKVDIKPLLMRKGSTQLAIYGLSHIRDERLNRLFEKNQVDIERPDGEIDDWFHLMVLHQNRAMRGHKNFLPEEILPEFLNLVIWGHEHDCRIEPEHVPKRDFYISQPGSSVPTSLADGEAIKKHVGILEIYKNKFKLQAMPLRTVRPFIFESIDLEEIAADGSLDGADASEIVRAMAEERIEAMIERSKALLTGHENQPVLPLIRLRLVYSLQEHMFNAIRVGQVYNKRIANPSDVIHFKKPIKRLKKGDDDFDKEAFQKAFKKMELENNTRLEDLLERYFVDADGSSKQLQLMPMKLLTDMTTQMVERRDPVAVDNMVSNFEATALERIMDAALSANDDVEEQLKLLQSSMTVEEIADFSRQLKNNSSSSSIANASGRSSSAKAAKKRKHDINDNSDDELAAMDLDFEAATVTKAAAPTRARGRGRGRGARSSGGGGTAAASSKQSTTTKHRMAELNVSITGGARKSTRDSSQRSVLESFATSTRAKKTYTYTISDSDD